MALFKAISITQAIKLIDAQGEAIASKFWENLPPEDKHFFRKLLPISRIPVERAAYFFEQVVSFLYPDKTPTQGLMLLGENSAKNSLNGIYKFLMGFVSMETCIKRCAVLWKTYHEKGTASAKYVGPGQFAFIIENYPDLPKTILDILTGYLSYIAKLSGVKNPKLIRDDSDPNAWQWMVYV